MVSNSGIVGSTKQNGARFQASPIPVASREPFWKLGKWAQCSKLYVPAKELIEKPDVTKIAILSVVGPDALEQYNHSNGKKVKTVKIRPGEDKVWDRVSWPQMHCILQISVLESLENLRPNIWLIPTTLSYDALSLSCEFAEPGNMVRAKIVFFPL